MSKKKLRDKLAQVQGQARYYKSQMRAAYNGHKLINGSKEVLTIMTIEGGFLLADKKGGSIGSPVRFYKTPDELCEALKRDLSVAAMTR